ncbi:Multidrug resistance regulator 1 [Elsinoe australis]|uniref:Multidrug resistance regulator 1 n=1 Tax=Elsinoe australis TaxID=40998 RepID=A0A2P7ZD80_9PEZI|nr:Multidrug resistance regulator 1 [Elsinoe australis]
MANLGDRMTSETSDRVDHIGPVKRRRFHKKTRLGCENCKKRKVKCDETHPSCANCERFELRCRYPARVGLPAAVVSQHRLEEEASRASTVVLTPPSHQPSSNTPSPHSVVPSIPNKRKRGRPRKHLPTAGLTLPESNPSPSTPLAQPSPTPNTTAAPPNALNTDDLQFLYHYTTQTAASLTMDDTSPSSWAHKAVTIAFDPATSYVMHFPLAISAFHIAHLRSEDRQHFRNLGETHLRVGLAKVADIVRNLDESSALGVFLATMLVCFCAWARGPEDGDLMLVSDRGEAVWWTMLKGLQGVLAKVGGAGVFKDAFDDADTADDTSHNGDGNEQVAADRQSTSPIAFEWQEQFSSLRTSFKAGSNDNIDMYLSTLDSLAEVFEATFGTPEEPRAGPAVFQVIFGWFFRIGDDFVTLLQDKRKPALVLMAHFLVLMEHLPRCWFLEGWTEHILRGVRGHLGDDWGEAIAWVARHCSLDVS